MERDRLPALCEEQHTPGWFQQHGFRLPQQLVTLIDQPRERNCVEVGWRTSSCSYDNGGCVEVAPAPDAVLVRDFKDRTGPALTVPITAWHAFLTTVTR